MGCLQLHIEPLPSLRVIHRKKEIKPKKSVGSYYPFGLKHKGYNNATNSLGNSTAQKKGFANEELEEEFGKKTIAYQWRDYDPALGRFNKIDRFAEKYSSHSTYAFTKNNPIFFKEIKGDSINVSELYAKNKKGEYLHKTQIKAFEWHSLLETTTKRFQHWKSH